MCDIEPKPQQNAIAGVCIALAVVVVGLVGISYAVWWIDPIPPDQIFVSTLKVFALLGILAGMAFLITWLVKTDEQQTFDPPV